MFIQTTGKNKAEKFIENRRAQDDKVSGLKTQLKQEFQYRELASFENKGKKVAERNYINNRLAEMKEKRNKDIEQKREELRSLLNQEDTQYQDEIKGMEETPEQTRQKMMARVAELKAQKEELRQQFVAQKLEKRFRDGADELRKMESELEEVKTKHLRDIQMMEKQQIMEREYQEEMVYAELWKRDHQRKLLKEQEEVIERAHKNQDRNRVLGWQKEENEHARQQKAQEILDEKKMLNDQWALEAARQKAQELAQLELNKQLNKEIFDHNIQQRAIKDSILNNEKRQDKEIIDNNVRREKMLEQIEKEYRDRIKRENQEFLRNFQNRSNELRTYEAELERLIKQEEDRQWKKRTDVWQKEEDARIKLMYEVYNSRFTEILKKKEQSTIIKAEKEVEKDKVTQDILNYEEELKNKKLQIYEQNKGHQKGILSQMVEKQEAQRRQMQEKIEKEKADIRANIEYINKVREEKERGKQKVSIFMPIKPDLEFKLEELRRYRPY